jgi:hypothetical protein
MPSISHDDKVSLLELRHILVPISSFMTVKKITLGVRILGLDYEKFIRYMTGIISNRLICITIPATYDEHDSFFYRIRDANYPFIWDLTVCKENRDIVSSFNSFIFLNQDKKSARDQYIKIYVTHREKKNIVSLVSSIPNGRNLVSLCDEMMFGTLTSTYILDYESERKIMYVLLIVI